MILNFKNLSVNFKLILMMSLASAIGLILLTSAVIFNETRRANSDTIQELTALADVVGWNTAAAMAFDDPGAARETLKSLNTHADIVASILCDKKNKPFSYYISPKYTDMAPLPLINTKSWDCSHLSSSDTDPLYHFIARKITLQGEPVGSIHLIYQQNTLIKQLDHYYFLVSSIAIISFLIVVLISTRLQKVFTAPMTELMQTMKSVSSEKKYDIRANKISNDEYGTLVDVFNEMLNEIQQRDSQLASYSQRLESEVAERTKDIYKKNNELQTITIEALQAKNIAEKASRVKSEFMATISHEIRTPMNGVLGMVEILLRTKLTAKQVKLLNTVQRSGQSLLVIINEILDFSKFEAGKLTLDKQAFRPHSLLQDTLELFTEDARAKSITLRPEFIIDEHLVLIGDKNRLQQVISNLLSNALKFTNRGEITLRCSIPELGQFNDNEHIKLYFEVEDTGIGIPYDKQGVVFESFSQVDSSTTRQYSGTGLGLSICKQLVSLMGGDIGVNSEYNSGSTFWFTVTLELGEADLLPDNVPKQQCAQETPQFSATILIAEDNQVNQELARTMLEILGCEVLLANNGAEAIKVADNQAVDMILMDCHMPQIDGFRATEHLRTQTESPNHKIPIIALTADIRDGIKQQCINTGMNDYISKPFTLNKLAETLTQWLDSSKHLPPIASFKEQDISNNAKAIDQSAWQTIHELQRPDQPDILHKLIRIYLENTPDLIDLLSQYAREKDAHAFAETAHTLKSSSRNLGAVRLAQLCEKIECNTDSDSNNQHKAFMLIDKIKNEFQQVKTELQEELSKHLTT